MVKAEVLMACFPGVGSNDPYVPYLDLRGLRQKVPVGGKKAQQKPKLVVLGS